MASTFAAREVEARAALGRLRDCSRRLEQASAAVVLRRRPERDRVRLRLRALTTEAARLRVELREWDISSPEWIGRVNARLDQLAQEIEAVPRGNTSSADALAAGSEPIKPAQDQVERRVYDYLYPRSAVPAAFG